MDEKIIAKCEELKQIIAEYFKSDRSDKDGFIAKVKTKISEFSEMLETPEETEEE